MLDIGDSNYATLYVDIPQKSWRAIQVTISLVIDNQIELNALILGTTKFTKIKPFYSLNFDSECAVIKTENKVIETLNLIQIASTKMMYATTITLNWLRKTYPEYKWVERN